MMSWPFWSIPAIRSPGSPQAALAEVYDSRGTIDDWGKFGVRVPNSPGNRIHLTGRQVTSGTHDDFQEVVLGERRDFKHNMESRDVSNSGEVVDLIAGNPCAIGYIGMAFESPSVKRLKNSWESGTELVEPTIENVMNRRYPISRPLLMYSNGMPQGEVKRYLAWILSDAGQCRVPKSGFARARPVTCPEK
ncbi:MAG: substrate-binding domain-containing protein [Magnetococcales bacterium]|nr:substrate-binding domain-containing protein [Magnetococcales bacterium]